MSNSMNRREFIGHSARAVAGSYFLAKGVNAVSGCTRACPACLKWTDSHSETV